MKPLDVQALLSKLKRRAAYWRRKEAAHHDSLRFSNFPIVQMKRDICDGTARGLDEAIAIIEKAVAGRGVRGKRRV